MYRIHGQKDVTSVWVAVAVRSQNLISPPNPAPEPKVLTTSPSQIIRFSASTRPWAANSTAQVKVVRIRTPNNGRSNR